MSVFEIFLFTGIIGLFWGIQIIDKVITVDKFKAWGGAGLIILAIIFGNVL